MTASWGSPVVYIQKPSNRAMDSLLRLRERCGECSFWIKYTLFILNFLVWMGGTCLIAIGLWSRMQRSSMGSVDNLTTDPALLLIGVGIIMFVISICGCVGAVRENICLLKVFCVVIIVVFLLEVVAGVLTFVFMDAVERHLLWFMHTAITTYPDDTELQNTIDYIQKRFECCGARNFEDWNDNMYYNCSSRSQMRCGVPMSCCKNPTSVQCGLHTRNRGELTASNHIYTHGCIYILMQLFQDNLIVVAFIAFGVGLVELFAIALAHVLIKHIIFAQKEFNERSTLQPTQQTHYDTATAGSVQSQQHQLTGEDNQKHAPF